MLGHSWHLYLSKVLLKGIPKYINDLGLWFTLQEIAELYESEANIEKAIDFYEKAADFFQGEEVTTSANQCKQKVAQFAAQLEQ